MTDADLDARYPVCLVGLGACSPLGLTAPTTAAALRAAISAITDHPFMVDQLGDRMKVARVPVLDPLQWGVERFLALAGPALEEALTPILATHARQAVPLLLGLPEARPGWPQEASTQLADKLKQPGAFAVQPSPITAMPNGHAAGLIAIDEAARLVRSGRIEFAVAGGVDSYLIPETLEWLDDQEQLKSAQHRAGFPPGEGAGFLLLTATAVARRRGLPVLAWFAAGGNSVEKNRIKTETVCVGLGLTEAIRTVVGGLRLPEERIDYTYCDLNGERYRSEEWTYALLRTQEAMVKNQNFLTPADCWGDVGAASGPLFTALAVGSAQRSYATGPRILAWAGSESGARAAVLWHLNTSNGVGP